MYATNILNGEAYSLGQLKIKTSFFKNRTFSQKKCSRSSYQGNMEVEDDESLISFRSETFSNGPRSEGFMSPNKFQQKSPLMKKQRSFRRTPRTSKSNNALNTIVENQLEYLPTPKKRAEHLVDTPTQSLEIQDSNKKISSGKINSSQRK